MFDPSVIVTYESLKVFEPVNRCLRLYLLLLLLMKTTSLKSQAQSFGVL